MEIKIEPDDSLLSSNISDDGNHDNSDQQYTNYLWDSGNNSKYEVHIKKEENVQEIRTETKEFITIEIEPIIKREEPTLNSTENLFGIKVEKPEIKNEHSKPDKVAAIVLEKRKFFEQNFVCSTCYDIYSTSFILKQHENIHSKSKSSDATAQAGELPYHCEYCDFKTKHMCRYKTHTMSHTGEKPFKCDQCPFAFSQSYNLKTHKMSHSGEKPFKCTLCAFKCASSSSLKKHKMRHTGEKPYKCNYCGYKSTQMAHLKTHVLSHTGERPFHCDQCDGKFKLNSHLKRHKESHDKVVPVSKRLAKKKKPFTGEKRYKCDKCDYKTGQSSVLKRHYLTHTGEKPYTCVTCNLKFTRAENLKYHKKTHGH